MLRMLRMRINEAWHKANVMPKNATLDQRILRHAEHAKHCACRPVPPPLLELVEKHEG